MMGTVGRIIVGLSRPLFVVVVVVVVHSLSVLVLGSRVVLATCRFLQCFERL
jgi:hypothetical protein